MLNELDGTDKPICQEGTDKTVCQEGTDKPVLKSTKKSYSRRPKGSIINYMTPRKQLKYYDKKDKYETGCLSIVFQEDSMILEEKDLTTGAVFSVKLYYENISEISILQGRYGHSDILVIYADEQYTISLFDLEPLRILLNRKLFLFQKRRLEKIEKDIQTLMYAPEGGGPLYQEAKQRFYDNRGLINSRGH